MGWLGRMGRVFAVAAGAVVRVFVRCGRLLSVRGGGRMLLFVSLAVRMG